MLFHSFAGKSCQCADVGIDDIWRDCTEIFHTLCDEIVHHVGRLLYIVVNGHFGIALFLTVFLKLTAFFMKKWFRQDCPMLVVKLFFIDWC